MIYIISFRVRRHIEVQVVDGNDVTSCQRQFRQVAILIQMHLGSYLLTRKHGIYIGGIDVYVKELFFMSCIMRKPDFSYAKTKANISCAVIAQLISAFVFVTRIVRSLFLFNPKFQSSSHLL